MTNHLADDITRCSGVREEGEWRKGCEDCLRRTAPIPKDKWVFYMSPPPIVVFECERRIAP